MKIFPTLLLGAALSMSGCSQHVWVTSKNSNQIRPAINKTGIKHTGIITLNDGKVLKVNKVHVEGDTISFIAGSLNETITISIEDIKELKFKRTGKGVVEGFFTGILTGGILGAVVGYAEGDDPPGWFSMTAGEKAAALGLGFGIIGGVAGLVGGAIHGSVDNYYFKALEIQTRSELKVDVRINYPLYE
ncbi:MAG: hypothetical protein JSW33_08290 [bacterium]|nr:MAG: hypothetical protein JSW33_08290 [bacterium]